MARPAASASSHDLDLAALAASGDRAAFGELVRRHAPGVRGLLRRMGADPAVADDIAQDAFLTAFEQISEFRGQGSFAGWLKRIAARLFVKRWRKEARYQLLAEPGEDEAGAELGPGPDRLIDLDEALKSLAAGERLCVTLCYGVGLSHGEAAAALNIPLGTVKSHVKRGLSRLRARLAPGASEGLVGNG